MIIISFDQNHRFSKKPISLYDGLNLLSQVEDQVIEESNEESVYIRIYLADGKKVKKAAPNFEAELILGQGYGKNLLEFIEEKTAAYYSKEAAGEFIGLLASEIMEGTRKEHAQPIPVEEPQPVKISNSSKNWIRVIITSVLGLVLFLGTSYAAIHIYHVFQETKTDEITLSSKEQLQLRLQDESPNNLAKEEPKEIITIATILAEEKRFEELKEFNQEWPTSEGTFDLAFHQEEWETVVSLSDTSLTEERKVMLAYSFIQLDRLEEAEILNRTLDSEKLSVLITEQWMVRGIKYIQEGKFKEAEDIQIKLSNPYLEELLETGKTCQEMIDFYKDQKDDGNRELWEKRLKNLGEEYLEHETQKTVT